jgi:hypothetical protein
MSKTTTLGLILAIFMASGLFALHTAYALPSGSTITFNSTAGVPNPSADSRADARGTITTLIINGLQQDQYWKAYVGNVTGRLSLDDASGNTIYDWSLSSVNKTGQVFVTKNNTVNFVNLSCISTPILQAEHDFFSMLVTSTDNVNNTFNYTSHGAITISGGTNIAANSCRSTATYRNDTVQTIDGNQRFQEILLQDNQNVTVYATIFSALTSGYDNSIYDFQMIVPERNTGSPTTYYFYTQLS